VICAIGAGSSACADLFGFKTLREGDAGGPDAQPDTFVDPCPHARWPGPPDASEPGTQAEHTLAFRHAYFSTATVDGGVPDFGYDLDMKCTTDQASASCAGPVITDDSNGRDNASISLMGTLSAITQGAVDDTVVNATIEAGQFTVILRLLGLQSIVNQQSSTGLSLGVQASPGLQNGGTPVFDGTDRWLVASEDCQSPTTNVPYPINQAYVNNGVFVSTATSTINLRILLPSTNAVSGTLLVKLSHPVLTGTLAQTDAGVAMNDGLIAGRWNADDMLAALADLTAPGNVPVCDYLQGNAYKSVLSAVCAARDIDTTGTDDGKIACDGISVAIRFDAIPAQVATNPVPFPQPTTPCTHEAGTCPCAADGGACP
jgi:hypothetical protein